MIDISNRFKNKGEWHVKEYMNWLNSYLFKNGHFKGIEYNFEKNSTESCLKI